MQRRHLTSLFTAALLGAVAVPGPAMAGVTLTYDDQMGSDGSGVAGETATAIDTAAPDDTSTPGKQATEMPVPTSTATATPTTSAEPTAPSASTTASDSGGETTSATMTAVEPFRVLDTRESSEGKVDGGSWIEFTVSGKGGVPADAQAVSLNVTVTEPDGPGFLTVYPAGESRPTASNVNYVPGQTVPNHVISAVSSTGKVRVYTMTTAHVVVDVAGYASADSEYVGLNPKRILDTRNGVGGHTGMVAAGGTVNVKLSSKHCGKISDVAAVVVNLTATEARSAGYVTAFEAGTTRPTASNINYTSGSTVAGLAIIPVNDDGTFSLYTHGETHLVADLAGYIPDGSSFASMMPKRVLDTREDDYGEGKLGDRQEVTIDLAEHGIGSAATTAAVLNITATGGAGGGFVTAYPAGVSRPTTSVVNFEVGQSVANSMIAKVGADRKITLYVSRSAHLVVDVQGTFADDQSVTEPTAGPTATVTVTITPTPTATVTVVPQPTNTATVSPTAQPTTSPTPVPTTSPIPTVTVTETATPTATVTVTASPTAATSEVAVTKVKPDTVQVGDVVTLRGKGLDTVTTVVWGDLTITEFTRKKANLLRFKVPAGSDGSNELVLLTSSETIATGKTLTVTASASATVEVTKVSATKTSSGDVITVTGTGFDTVTGAMFGDAVVGDLNVVSDTVMEVTVPSGLGGKHELVLSTSTTDIRTDHWVTITQTPCTPSTSECPGSTAMSEFTWWGTWQSHTSWSKKSTSSVRWCHSLDTCGASSNCITWF